MMVATHAIADIIAAALAERDRRCSPVEFPAMPVMIPLPSRRHRLPGRVESPPGAGRQLANRATQVKAAHEWCAAAAGEGPDSSVAGAKRTQLPFWQGRRMSSCT